MEPNLDYEIERWMETHGSRVTFNREGRKIFLDFAREPTTTWAGNFRDYSAAFERMATLAEGGRITVAGVREEIEPLKDSPGEPRRPLSHPKRGLGEYRKRPTLPLVLLEPCGTARAVFPWRGEQKEAPLQGFFVGL